MSAFDCFIMDDQFSAPNGLAIHVKLRPRKRGARSIDLLLTLLALIVG